MIVTPQDTTMLSHDVSCFIIFQWCLIAAAPLYLMVSHDVSYNAIMSHDALSYGVSHLMMPHDVL